MSLDVPLVTGWWEKGASYSSPSPPSAFSLYYWILMLVFAVPAPALSEE